MKESDGFWAFVALEVILVSAISFVFNDILLSFRLSLSYLWLYFMPGLPLYFRLETEMLERMLLINLFGLCIIPVLLFLVGYLVMPLNRVVIMGIPFIVFSINMIRLK